MKHFTELTVPDRAALLTGMRQSLGLALEDDGSVAAYAEAIAFADDLAAVLMLAESIDSAVHLFDACAFNVDPTDLIENYGTAMVSLALRLACVERVEIGARNLWRVADAGVNDPTLKLDGDLLARWAQHYQ